MGEATWWGPGIVPRGAIQMGLNLIQISNEFILFQNPTKFGQSKIDLSLLKNFEIKYGFEDLEKMNNLLHRNFFRL
jgi:hypothetical protein